MKITVKDIAKKANVSDGTVSNALNNKKGISEEKREYILKIAKDMGYFKKPNSTYDSIRLIIIKKEAHIVRDTPFFAELIQGIETEASKLKYELAISYLNLPVKNNNELENILKSNTSSGLLVLGTELQQSDLKIFENTALPTVFLDVSFNNQNFDYVAINNVDGAYELVESVIKKGHTCLGLINSIQEINNFKERKKGYMQALIDYNLPIMYEYEAIVEPTFDGSFKDLKVFLESAISEIGISHLPTAFFAVNDEIAIGAQKAISSLGLDISICGFDDLIISEMATPPLTTVRVNKSYLGKSAVERLVNKIKTEDTSIKKILVSTKIIERESIKTII